MSLLNMVASKRSTTSRSCRTDLSQTYDHHPYPPRTLSNTFQVDLDTYKQSLQETNSRIPTQSQLKKKYEDIKKLTDHFWTDADINARLTRSNKYNHLLNSKSSGNAGPRIATATEIEAQRVAELNKRNRAADSIRVRNALVEERRATQNERKQRERAAAQRRADEAARKKEEEEKAARKTDDLFEGDSRAGTPRAGTPKPGEKKKEARKGLPTFRKPKMDDDIIASMDIGVEIEI
jgi:RNA polymerase-associated protein RTF1